MITAPARYISLYPDVFGKSLIYYKQEDTLIDLTYPVYIYLTPNPTRDIVYLIHTSDKWIINNPQHAIVYAEVTGKGVIEKKYGLIITSKKFNIIVAYKIN